MLIAGKIFLQVTDLGKLSRFGSLAVVTASLKRCISVLLVVIESTDLGLVASLLVALDSLIFVWVV